MHLFESPAVAKVQREGPSLAGCDEVLLVSKPMPSALLFAS